MIRFQVFGQPGTKGSAQAFIAPPINTVERLDKVRANMLAGGRPPRAIITNDAGQGAKTWASVVGDAARVAMGKAPPFDCPVRVRCVFHLKRPQSHYRPHGPLRPNAPVYAPTKPDGDKLERCTWDALTGVLFIDDGRIVEWSGAKMYTNDGRTGATIEVEPITATVPAALTRAPSPQAELPIEEEVL